MEPIINLEDPPGKIVGRRRIADSFECGMKIQKAGASITQRIAIPKGVYRFHTHEEADEWLMTKLAEAAAKKDRH